jgi:hypothetical protein
MDGDPVARDRVQVHEEADGLGIPWNRRTFDKFQILEDAWQGELDKEREKRAADSKKQQQEGARVKHRG